MTKSRLTALFTVVREVGAQLALERRLRARAPGLRLGRAIDIRGDDERLVIGRDVQIDAFTTLHCGGAGWGPEATRIVIGDQAYIGPAASCSAPTASFSRRIC